MKQTKIFIYSILVMSLFTNACSAQKKHLAVGDSIPLFSLPDQDSTMFNVSDVIGKKKLVLFFYPKDESAVCTKEACSFRDNFTEFTKAGAMVIGINAGSVKSHKSFQQNHNLPFTLLSDADNKVLQLFGVKNKFFITGRETFVVDLNGKIVYTYNSMLQGTRHVAETLKYLQTGAAE